MRNVTEEMRRRGAVPGFVPGVLVTGDKEAGDGGMRENEELGSCELFMANCVLCISNCELCAVSCVL